MHSYKHHTSLRLPGFASKLNYAGRRVYAWWEGHGFDPALERRAVLLRSHLNKSLSTLTDRADFVGEAVWGPGRLSPGSPAWTMHLARALMIDTRARVGVFGAERGGPLQDLNNGTRWSVHGFARRMVNLRTGRLDDYARARQRLNKPSLDGALVLFDLHHEADPASMLRLTYEMLKPGAKGVIVDFTSLRKNVRLKAAFTAPWQGALRQSVAYENAVENTGLRVSAVVDDTGIFLPLIARGWAGWRYAWQILGDVKDNRQRAALLRLMSDHAALWAERHDALCSGQLQVTRLMVEKPRLAGQ